MSKEKPKDVLIKVFSNNNMDSQRFLHSLRTISLVRTMSYKFEISEKVDYGAVINMHLNRIAAIRSELYHVEEGISRTPFDPIERVFLKYLSAAEALYTILLPELRGESRKYLLSARRIYHLHKRLNKIEEEIEREQDIADSIESTKELLWKDKSRLEAEKAKLYEKIKKLEEKAKELENKIEKTIESLGQDVLENWRSARYLYHKMMFIVDKAIEEMVKQLNEAGLLMRGKNVRVSTIGTGTFDKSSLQE